MEKYAFTVAMHCALKHMIESRGVKKLKHCKPGLEQEALLVFCSVYTKKTVNEIYPNQN